MFDVEQYDGRPFDYSKQELRTSKSFAEYRPKVRAPGREWMRAVNAHDPDITTLLSFGYALAQPDGGKDRSTCS
jgi:hypothetical protein